MSIPMNSVCFQCHLGRTLDRARPLGDDAAATKLTRELMKIYAALPESASSPYIGPATAKLMQELYGQDPDHMRREKEESNRFVMERFGDICSRVEQAEDPLLAALQFSILAITWILSPCRAR